MKPCDRVRQLLGDFLDDELDAELCAELERHLADCPDCEVVVHTTRRTLALYRGHELHRELPLEVHRRLMGRLRSQLGQGE
ncbi:MAG: zf-HC2 domain-containing protein [Candidatus Eremiobacterota bacterium]